MGAHQIATDARNKAQKNRHQIQTSAFGDATNLFQRAANFRFPPFLHELPRCPGSLQQVCFGLSVDIRRFSVWSLTGQHPCATSTAALRRKRPLQSLPFGLETQPSTAAVPREKRSLMQGAAIFWGWTAAERTKGELASVAAMAAFKKGEYFLLCISVQVRLTNHPQSFATSSTKPLVSKR